MDESRSTSPIFSDSEWFFNTFDSKWLELKWLEGYQPSWGVLFVVCAVVVYSAWYYLLVVDKPRLVGGGTSLRKHIVTHCPIVSHYYYPTFWAPNYHFTTIGRAKLQKCPGVTYDREILNLDDGGVLALDWAANLPAECDKDDAPVLLFLSGITGSSSDNYVKYSMLDGIRHGYRPLVMNYRGCGGINLTTMRTNSATSIDDLIAVTNRIHELYPKADIVGLGISLGGIILTQYCHQMGKNSKLKGVISVSAGMDPFISMETLENQLINRLIYIRFITNQLCNIVRKNIADLTPDQLSQLPIDINRLLQSKTISQFDEHLTVPLFGYSSVNEYYRAARNSDKLYKICIPYISISATDDPFVPEKSIPYGEFEGNPHTLLIATSRGGHFGFLEGLWPTKETWMNRLNGQLLAALKDYKQ